MQKILLTLIVMLVVFVGLALFWPSKFDPQAWTPPAAPEQDLAQPPPPNPFADQSPMTGLQRLDTGAGHGPETVAVDAHGRLYAGFDDGTIHRMDADGEHDTVFASTNGRPLGMVFGAPLPQAKRRGMPPATDGNGNGDEAENDSDATDTARQGGQTLYVADAEQGLLAVDPQGRITILATGAEGRPFGLTDDVDVAANGQIYFTDASSKYALDAYRTSILEHGGHGRLLNYDPTTGQTHVLMRGLQFANGVAVGPDADYLLVTETGSYRVIRYWLSGPQVGTHDVFIDDLPGFPDGISYNGHDTFWLALFAPRNTLLDFLANKPWLRRIVYRIPLWLQPKPAHVGQIVALDDNGQVRLNLVDSQQTSYAPVTSVVQAGATLYLGSLLENSIARLPVPGRTP